MWITALSTRESLDLVARTQFGRLGCALGLQPYVVPFSFAYRDDHLYGFSGVGMKIEWMRNNPLVCVQSDEIVTSREWRSVVIFGTYRAYGGRFGRRPQLARPCAPSLAAIRG